MPRASAAAAAPAHAPAPRRSPGAAPARRRSGPASPPPAGRPREPVRESATPSPPSVRLPARRGTRGHATLRFIEARTNGMVDQLLRGRLWVGLMGALLAGIVFLNVSLLQLNRDIGRTTTQATALDHQNSRLRARLASVDSSERFQRLALAHGMIMPAPGQYRYLVARPWLDAALAAQRVMPPSLTAGALAAAPAPAPAPAPASSTVATTATAAAASPTAANPQAGTQGTTAQTAPTAATAAAATGAP